MSTADAPAYLYTKQEKDQQHIDGKSLSRCSGWVPGNRDRPDNRRTLVGNRQRQHYRAQTVDDIIANNLQSKAMSPTPTDPRPSPAFALTIAVPLA